MIPLWTGRHDFPPSHRKPFSLNHFHPPPKTNLQSPFCHLQSLPRIPKHFATQRKLVHFLVAWNEKRPRPQSRDRFFVGNKKGWKALRSTEAVGLKLLEPSTDAPKIEWSKRRRFRHPRRRNHPAIRNHGSNRSGQHMPRNFGKLISQPLFEALDFFFQRINLGKQFGRRDFCTHATSSTRASNERSPMVIFILRLCGPEGFAPSFGLSLATGVGAGRLPWNQSEVCCGNIA